jgi:hypothetical protein
MNFLPSDTPADIMEKTEEMETVGEEISEDVYIDLSCMWPPATNLAFIFKRLPCGSTLSRTKQLILIIFFLWVSDRLDFITAENTFFFKSADISSYIALTPLSPKASRAFLADT